MILSTVREMRTITVHTSATTHVGVYSNVVPPSAISSLRNSLFEQQQLAERKKQFLSIKDAGLVGLCGRTISR